MQKLKYKVHSRTAENLINFKKKGQNTPELYKKSVVNYMNC